MALSKLFRKIGTSSSHKNRCKHAQHSLATVGITEDLASITVVHQGIPVVIKREANPDAKIPALFAKTSRPCPPFCIQPMQVADKVETIGELELLSYLKVANKKSVLVIDSRLANWVEKGTIPGSVNIPWTAITATEGMALKQVFKLFTSQFGVKQIKTPSIEAATRLIALHKGHTLFDFTQAKTLVLFCNGPWCGQTTESIQALLALGYPPEKIKYYRDGMQGWVSLGLTIIGNTNNKVCKTH